MLSKPSKTAAEQLADLGHIPLEADIQEGIKQFLLASRCEVLETLKGIDPALAKLARSMGKAAHRGTSGVPDLLAARSTWPIGAWLGIEVKRPKLGRLSPEQQRLESLGRIVVCRSIEDAERALIAFDSAIGRRA